MPQNRTIARLLAGESDNHILPFSGSTVRTKPLCGN